ncbi:MAG: SDR family NAD(P)-dependent oxidoreductase [Candidatus Hydrogenedentes bacterium]|nr:SDR family NAD(P)-dependent oxidoreductase [Candidatus Hydrogenedentota bacterium]
MHPRFEGKAIFVTGASSGIGAALAREFAREGARVALAARRAGALEEIALTITTNGGTAVSLTCDVTDQASVCAAVASAAGQFGGIDVAVANAGFGVSGAFERLNTADFRRQFDTNFFGVLNTVYACLPHLEKTKGRLAIVSSVMGRAGMPASAPYCASKFAVCGLAECLHYDLAAKGISVTCINPGLVESNIRRTDNDGVFKDERKDPAPSFLVMPAERAARAMINAIHRRQFEATITGHGKLIAFAARHLPRTFRTALRLATRNRIEEVENRKRG